MEQIAYRVVRSNRRTIAIQIKQEGVVVRAPWGMPESRIDAFVQSKARWICTHLENRPTERPGFSADEIRKLYDQAQRILPEKVAYYAKLLGVTYGRITVRSQKTRWGSCSAKGNLNFNCLLVLAPEKVMDYVVVHELCHRKQMNHSAKFWDLVAKTFPDHAQCRRWLKENGSNLISRLPK